MKGLDGTKFDKLENTKNISKNPGSVIRYTKPPAARFEIGTSIMIVHTLEDRELVIKETTVIVQVLILMY